MEIYERAGNEIAAVLWECCTVEECENVLAEIHPDDWKRAAQKAIEAAIPRGAVSPRGDSLDNQLRHVRMMAEQAGCYAAADWIRARTLYEPDTEHVLPHWLATNPAYSTDPTDAKYLVTEDETEWYRASGWRVDGPYVGARCLRGVVSDTPGRTRDYREALEHIANHGEAPPLPPFTSDDGICHRPPEDCARDALNHGGR